MAGPARQSPQRCCLAETNALPPARCEHSIGPSGSASAPRVLSSRPSARPASPAGRSCRLSRHVHPTTSTTARFAPRTSHNQCLSPRIGVARHRSDRSPEGCRGRKAPPTLGRLCGRAVGSHSAHCKLCAKSQTTVLPPHSNATRHFAASAAFGHTARRQSRSCVE